MLIQRIAEKFLNL